LDRSIDIPFGVRHIPKIGSGLHKGPVLCASFYGGGQKQHTQKSEEEASTSLVRVHTSRESVVES